MAFTFNAVLSLMSLWEKVLYVYGQYQVRLERGLSQD